MKTTKWFNLKSKIVFAFLIVLQLNSYAQNETWVLVLPDNGGPVDMAQVDDSSYCVLQYVAKDTLIISEITSTGEVIWRNLITENIEAEDGYNYLHIENVDDSIILVAGTYNDKPFCLVLDKLGNIVRQDFFEFDYNAIVYDVESVFNNKVWLVLVENNRSLFSMMEYSVLEGSLDTVSSFPTGLNIEFVLSADSIVLRSGSNLIFVNSVCDTILHREIAVERFSQTVFNFTNNLFYSICEHHSGVQYSHGIYCYNRELDSVAYFPDSIYYPTGVYGSWMNANDIIFNETGQMIIVGEIYFMSEWFPTLVNASPLTAVPNFVYTNYNSVPQYSRRVFEVENGYIQLLYYEAAEESKTVIVRVSENGDMNSVNENKNEVLSIYPNPADNGFTVDFETGASGTYKIYNEMGVLTVIKEFQNVHSLYIDTQNFRSGLYNLRVLIGDRLSSRKIIINHK